MKPLLFIALMATVCFACTTSTCTNTNPVFDQYSPESKEYKTELAKLLATSDPKTLTFWFSEYKSIGGKEFLYFRVKGKDLCALIPMQNSDWKRLEDLRQKQGKGYRGAEFTNLKFDIVQDSTGLVFEFRNYGEIID